MLDPRRDVAQLWARLARLSEASLRINESRLGVMQALFNQDVDRLCGLSGKDNSDRQGDRHGRTDGIVGLGGRRIPITRPRVRSADGSGELPVDSYEERRGTDLLGRMALERMIAGLSTRSYRSGLEPVGAEVEECAVGTGKSSVSRRFIAQTATALAELLARPLNEVDLVALMVDGVHFGDAVGTPDGIDVWIDLDIGKAEHFADARDAARRSCNMQTASRRRDGLTNFPGRSP